MSVQARTVSTWSCSRLVWLLFLLLLLPVTLALPTPAGCLPCDTALAKPCEVKCLTSDTVQGSTYGRADLVLGYVFSLVLIMNRDGPRFMDTAAQYLIYSALPEMKAHPKARFELGPNVWSVIPAAYTSLAQRLLEECRGLEVTFDEIVPSLGRILDDVHSMALFGLLGSLAQDVLKIPNPSLFWSDFAELQATAEHSSKQRMVLFARVVETSLAESVAAFGLDARQLQQAVSMLLSYIQMFPEQGKVISFISLSVSSKTDPAARCIQKLLHDYTVHFSSDSFLKLSFREMNEYLTRLEAQMKLESAMLLGPHATLSPNQTTLSHISM